MRKMYQLSLPKPGCFVPLPLVMKDYSTLPANKYDRETLRLKLELEGVSRVTLSFYKYAKIADPVEFRNILFRQWSELGVLGRTYVASEGINGQISVPEPQFERFKSQLYAFDFLNGIRLNIAVESSPKSFIKLIVRLREKIVADGLSDLSFDVTQPGPHLKAREFNDMMERPDAIVVDMRNHYESEVGHFQGAVCPDVDTFRDSLPIVEEMLKGKENSPVLLYCTGGIRCEKASAYFRHKGFQQVFQLEGGIIEYARQTKEQQLPNKFVGKNFVFDDRLGERISPEIIAHCHQCGEACDDHTNCKNEACHLLFIQCSSCLEKHQGCCSKDCQSELLLPISERRIRRRGKEAKRTYQKARLRPTLNPSSSSMGDDHE
jgi:UPF0176 protein